MLMLMLMLLLLLMMMMKNKVEPTSEPLFQQDAEGTM
jgi:hypothetical protein